MNGVVMAMKRPPIDRKSGKARKMPMLNRNKKPKKVIVYKGVNSMVVDASSKKKWIKNGWKVRK